MQSREFPNLYFCFAWTFFTNKDFDRNFANLRKKRTKGIIIIIIIIIKIKIKTSFVHGDFRNGVSLLLHCYQVLASIFTPIFVHTERLFSWQLWYRKVLKTKRTKFMIEK